MVCVGVLRPAWCMVVGGVSEWFVACGCWKVEISAAYDTTIAFDSSSANAAFGTLALARGEGKSHPREVPPIRDASILTSCTRGSGGMQP